MHKCLLLCDVRILTRIYHNLTRLYAHLLYTAVTAELSKPFGNIHRKCMQVGTNMVETHTSTSVSTWKTTNCELCIQLRTWNSKRGIKIAKPRATSALSFDKINEEQGAVTGVTECRGVMKIMQLSEYP